MTMKAAPAEMGTAAAELRAQLIIGSAGAPGICCLGTSGFRVFLYGQHHAIVSARIGGSFPPMLRFETLEIHKVCLRVSNLALTKNLSPNLLAESCGAALAN